MLPRFIVRLLSVKNSKIVRLEVARQVSLAEEARRKAEEQRKYQESCMRKCFFFVEYMLAFVEICIKELADSFLLDYSRSGESKRTSDATGGAF
ncbi:hypothetical protein HPP92_012482 [Vanilla planifolia]|uniref:Uncharacterized protein n=1 Tax=Vanilla planifolia TaxID=51239 RepID=A0A835QZJ3_VANPL|nr:hypothetical protein HPP92_012482 [Vanilla planifolia]